MASHKIFSMPFAKVYPMYIQKAERKNRTKDEVDEIIRWLTGYDQAALERQVEEAIERIRTIREQLSIISSKMVVLRLR